MLCENVLRCGLGHDAFRSLGRCISELGGLGCTWHFDYANDAESAGVSSWRHVTLQLCRLHINVMLWADWPMSFGRYELANGKFFQSFSGGCTFSALRPTMSCVLGVLMFAILLSRVMPLAVLLVLLVK